MLRRAARGVALESAFIAWSAEIDPPDGPAFDGKSRDVASLYHCLPRVRLDDRSAAVPGSARAGPHA